MRVLVTGASSQVGCFLLPLLVQHGCDCVAVSRKKHDRMDGMNWITADLAGDARDLWQGETYDVWIHLAFLGLASAHLEQAASVGVKYFIGFSSTSIFTKAHSASDHERLMIGQLQMAEERVRAVCQSQQIAWAVFRPTMIYGRGQDKNITFISTMIQRFGFFPLAGQAKGLRQPVHALDLANACMQILDHCKCPNRAYNLSGAEVLSYRTMVERVFMSLGKQPRLLQVWPLLMKYGLFILRLMPRYRHLSMDMIDRMNVDMAFDHADATADFDYRPRPFQP